MRSEKIVRVCARSAIIAGLSISVVRQAHAQGFEGSVAMRLSMGGGRSAPTSQEVSYQSRGGNTRVDLTTPMGAIIMIGLASEHKTFVIIESQKSYMEMTQAPTDQSAVIGKVTRTGKMETIAGNSCEHVTVDAAGPNGVMQRVDVCLSKVLGTYVNPMSAMPGGRLPTWQQSLTESGEFPLKVTLADGTVALEVLKIDKHRVSETLFRIPPSYNKVDVPKRP